VRGFGTTRGIGASTPPAIRTVGHSTRPLETFLAVLEAHGIELIADVRRFPGSRRLPQYGAEPLARALAARGIDYLWLPELGGRRRAPGGGSAWRHPAFRAYAAHMMSEEFAEGLFALLMAAPGLRTALLCAEMLWWRCHRRLIADVLVSLGLPVEHLRDAGPAEPHRLMPPARLVGGRLTYAPTKTAG
jgi:uncharacterized protein (DUF488 family)